MNKAPKDCLWVCLACGKTSEDQIDGVGEGSRGWDESCFLNSRLVKKCNITRKENGRVAQVTKLEREE